MISTTISHYKILEKIGSGGMGEVYLAEDSKLDRKVALKFLPKEYTKDQEANQRFQREAKAAAVLNHPNIVTIYEINEFEDQTYIAMEYVEGETLKELINANFKMQNENLKFEIDNLQFSMERIIDITTQICDGLQKAHEAGIVHRDIKPQNILIDKNGRVKILDFGLAKLKGVSQLTREKSTLGTTHYLSPEQALGKEVDHRSDIWSFGVILYEMLTGQHPFKGDYEQAVIYSILNEKAESLSSFRPDIPNTLEHLVNKMLEKKPEKRIQSIDEIIETIGNLSPQLHHAPPKKKRARMAISDKKMRWLLPAILGTIMILGGLVYILFITKPPLPESKSIAVLPFKNMSGDPQNEYFCDGITEDIITQLSKINDLKVTSRTSAFYFKKRNIKIKDIARELGVTSILEGSVRQSGEKVRITAQLINARTDNHLWAETYDRALKDIFEIQNDVATQIAHTLEIKLLPSVRNRINQIPTRNMEAYKLYLQGKLHWNKRTQNELDRAIQFFEKSVELDPEFALGYAALAETYVVIGEIWNILRMERDVERSNSAYQKAEEYCIKALSLDNQLAPVYASLGEIKTDWKWDFQAGEEAYKKAVELNPNYATGYQWLAEYYIISNQIPLAEKALNRAEKLDPFSFVIKFIRSHVLIAKGEYDKAIDILLKTIDEHPDFTLAVERLIDTYMVIKDYEQASRYARQINDENQITVIQFLIYISRNEKEQARRLFQEFIQTAPPAYSSPGMWAIAYTDLGEMNLAVKWFKKAIEEKDRMVLWRYTISRREALINDPRVKKMLKEIGLK